MANGTIVDAAGMRAGGLRVRTVWVALGFVLLAAVFYLDELRELAQRWSNEIGNSHGYLIAPLVFVLVWLQRDRLTAGRGGEALAVVGLVGSLVALAFARAASIDMIVYLLMPTTLWFALWLALGWPAARTLAFPVFYFVFALPVWAYLTPLLQWLTVQAVTVLLGVFGVEAFIQDEFVTVPAGVFEIAGGCSGTSYMVVALAIGTLMAFIERLPARKAAKLVFVAAMLAAVTNWIRVAIIIYWGNVTAMQTSLVEDHYTFGWWLFAGAMVIFFWYARRVARSEPDPVRGHATGDTAPIGVRVVTAAALLAIAPAWALALDRRDAGVVPTLAMPTVTGWTGPEAPEFEWEPVFLGAAAERMVTYHQESQVVDAYAAFYGRQEHGKKLVGYLSRVAGAEERWSEAEAGTVDAGSGVSVTERRVVGPGGQERLVWSWYEVRGQRLLSPRDVKLREGLSAFGLEPRSGVVALSTRCLPDCAAARERLRTVHAAGLGALTAGTGATS
jgi:EpsI family protein